MVHFSAKPKMNHISSPARAKRARGLEFNINLHKNCPPCCQCRCICPS
ncbi:MAG: hypothetical protein U5L45_13845 [Saprospiraceae bacterium]|nr:hypothetical protein [Saprospiraceae bacterium]